MHENKCKVPLENVIIEYIPIYAVSTNPAPTCAEVNCGDKLNQFIDCGYLQPVLSAAYGNCLELKYFPVPTDTSIDITSIEPSTSIESSNSDCVVSPTNDCTCDSPNPFPEYEEFAQCISGTWIIQGNVEKSNPELQTPVVIEGNVTLTGITHFILPSKLFQVISFLIIQQIRILDHGLLWKDV